MNNIHSFIIKIYSSLKYIQNTQVLCKDPVLELIEKLTLEGVELLNNSLNNVRFYNLIGNNLLKLLYENNEIIKIKCFNLHDYSDFVHLAMLIEKDLDLTNFIYKLYLISLINIYKEKCHNLQKIILSIIIIKLIDKYRQIDTYSEKDENQLKKIEDENIVFINNNINQYRDIGLVNSKISIEDLYCEIIYKVFKKGNFNNTVIEICKCLNLTSIDLTKKMYERLLKLFDEEDFVRNYQIINKRDLNNKNKVIFYYVLLYYILKDEVYIYQIQFLYQTQKFLRKLIKSNNHYEVLSDLDESLYDKIIYVLQTLLDSEYYHDALQNYLITLQNSNQSIIDENNNNNYIRLNNLVNELDLFKNETLITHRVITIINNSEHNRNNLTEKNNNKQKLEEIEEEHNTETNFKSNKMTELFKLEKGPIINHINLEDNYNDKVADGILKCYKIINEKQYLSGKGNYYTEFLTESEDFINETYKKDNKFTINIGEYQIEVYTYNSYIEGNENKLIFFDKKKKRIIKEINGYSFPISKNGMTIMHNEILLCPSKKYLQEQKQGIISIYFNFKQNIYRTFFHEIKDFVVNCICNLLDPEKKETNFILVGGFSKDISVRLYKINHNTFLKTIEVQFNRDIFIVENNFFTINKKQINLIKQSKKTGKIRIWSNKSIYLCSPLNLSKYLFFEEQERLESFYEYEDHNESERFYD